MRKISKISYILFFWIIFLLIKLLTLTSKLFLVKYIVRLLNANNKKILYLDPFFAENAGTKYRTHKWAGIQEENGMKVVIKNVYEKDQFDNLANHKQSLVLFQTGFIIKRIAHCVYSLGFKTVIVRRTILLYNEYGGGTFMERFLTAIHPNVILDLDDDMVIQDQSRNSLFAKILLENKDKFYLNLKVYNRFIVGSEYLKTKVLKNNSRVNVDNILVVPTCVDYGKYPAKKYYDNDVITFGWIGSSSNLPYIDMVIDALNSISKIHKIKLLIISGEEYRNPKALFSIENIDWSLETEVESLLKIDIGLMPLFNGPMEKGKCGFKLIQYMGLGIVSIASAVTVNKEIIDDEFNGFLVYDPNDWTAVIKKTISRKSEFTAIGNAARNKVEIRYSFNTYLAREYKDFVSSNKFNNTAKDKLRAVAQFVSYYGLYFFIQRKFEKTRDNIALKPGISAVISAKNEENTITLSLSSLLGFADQIICIDNGSDDKTMELMNEFQSNYKGKCEIEIVSLPNALLGDCRDEGLKRSNYQWHLRWDADMVFQTTGPESSMELRKKVMQTNKTTAFQLGRINLYGDFHHTTKIYNVIDTGETFLVRLCNKIKYEEVGRFDVIRLPIYYKIEKLTEKYIFHCDGIKSNLRLIYRNCYFDWREKFNSQGTEKANDYSDFPKFEKEWQMNRYHTTEKNSLIYRHQKETLPHLKAYDEETYVKYPVILSEHFKHGKERFKILYRNGKQYMRTDSADPSIEHYSATKEDIQYDSLAFLMKVLPQTYHNKLRF